MLILHGLYLGKTKNDDACLNYSNIFQSIFVQQFTSSLMTTLISTSIIKTFGSQSYMVSVDHLT